MENKKICAFLDILGFRSYILSDTNGALSLLEDYQDVLNQKIIDNKLHPPESYSDKDLKETAKKCLIDSFEYFLPFSDSILIVSNDPNLFIIQISHFVLDCFMLSSNLYTHPDNKEFPTTVRENEHWYPLLFRGGIVYEDVIAIEINSIEGSNLNVITNLSGKAVVKSVSLEKFDKGPRLFCNKEFIDLLSNDVKYLILSLEDGEHFEILWPAIIYNEFNDCKIEIHEFINIFIPAVNLWKAFNHLKEGIHYYKFLKLIVKSTISFFEWKGYLKEAKEFVSNIINDQGLELKKSDLVDSHFI